MRYDLITLGEALLRLTPPNGQLLEQAASLELHLGGSEANVAVGAARLGLRTCWLSRLADGATGRLIERRLGSHGVDTSHVRWEDGGRNGLYLLEEAPAPRGGRVTYDRSHTAASRMAPADLPEDLFRQGRARAFHTSGITLALGEAPAATGLRAMELARAARMLVGFDVNHRSTLPDSDRAIERYRRAMGVADVIFIALRDAVHLFGTAEEGRAALGKLHASYPQATIVMTAGADGAFAIDPRGDASHQPAIHARGPGRVGRGDAFVAGFLSRRLEEPDDPAGALAWGAAAAALKMTIPGDLPLLSPDDVQRVLRDGAASARDVRR